MSDAYDFTTLGITPGTWAYAPDYDENDGDIIIANDYSRPVAICFKSDLQDEGQYPRTEVVANSNLIAAAPDFLRYAMWEEEMAYINAQSNEGLDTKFANLEIVVLACKYFPDISELLSSMDDDDDEEEEAEKFWAAISKASLKLRQDALASVGLPALVDTDGESLIVRENGGAA